MIWMVFVAMALLALFGLLLPLLRPAAGAVYAPRADYDLAVYKDQLDEIARDVDRGVLSADQAGAARTEIQRRMLTAGETGAQARPIVSGSVGGRRLAVIIAVALPAVAAGLYAALGSPELPDQPYSGRAARIAQMRQQANTIQGMVDRLAERLRQDPSDGKGWAMLGRSYRSLGRTEEAKDAYLKAMALLPREISPRVEYAIVLLDEAEGETLPPESVKVLRQVLDLDPNQPDALYFVGLDAAQSGESARARGLWTKLLTNLPPESPARAQVQEQINALK